MSITVHPDVAPLQQRVRELRLELRSALDEWHRLSTEVRPRLHAAYNRHFGLLERELQEVSLAAAEIFRRVELLSIKHERGEKLTAEIIDLINQVVDKEYARFTMRVQEAFRMDERQREQAARSREADGSDTELVAMYRTLVKQLHPDVAEAHSEEPGSYSIWHQVQQAYATRNAAQLRSMLMLLGANEALERESGDWGVDRWRQEVDLLEQRLAVEQRKLLRLRSEEPFTMERDLDDHVWRTRHHEDLMRAIAVKNNELRDSRRRYDELTGGLVPPGHNPTKSKKEQTFEEDFMTNTYFGQR